ncbi:hypothetical protein RUM43_012525 [Polyplax serrata]|uniref:Sphingomyelin phosphodiesterase n=1 Tax=Polyplax serrata TaxID=468196 RepID=A0AAN8NKV1_POLSC
MVLLRFAAIAALLPFLGVPGHPSGGILNNCDSYWWTVQGNHFNGGLCMEQKKEAEHHTRVVRAYASQKDNQKRAKARLGEESSGGLGSIGSLMNLVNSNLNLNIKTDAGVACKACKTAVQMMKVFISLTKSDEDLLKIAIGLCSELKIMTDEVCDGLIRTNGPAIIHILRTSKMSPVDICSFLVKMDCEGTKNKDHIWHVDVPASRTKLAKKLRADDIVKEAPQLKVLHISDTHFDPHYQKDTWAECSLPLCCRNVTGEPDANATVAGPWGGWKCDIPEKTLDNLLEHINKQHPDIDYVIWTGDIPPHDVWSLKKTENLDIMNKTISKMMKHFPNIPVYPALGNHEVVPPNLFPTGEVDDQWSVDWLFERIGKDWSHWLGNDSSATIRKGAFYTIKARDGLRIVSLNTNYCYYNNWWLILNSTDPMGELKWLTEVLLEAENHDEKVHIIGHIPVGYNECLKIWQQNYYKIIERFSDTVTAQFFGHTHTDEFELFYNKNNTNKPYGVAYVGPSVTTYTYLNPGYRIYYVDGDHNDTTRFVLDHETWIMNLENANENDLPVWEKLYSAKEAYNMTSLAPQDWHDLYQRLLADDDLFDTYYRFYWKDSPRRPICDTECKRKLFCDIRSCDQYDQPVFGS